MNKLKFLSLVALTVLSATVWAAETEGPWTYVGMRSGTCDQNMNNSISYNNLDNSHWGTVTFWNYDNNGIGFVVQGSSKDYTKNAVYSLYSLTKTIPSYSRCQITWKYQVKGQNVKHYSRTTLYEHTNQSTLQAMATDFTLDLTDGSGSGSRLYSYSNKSFDGIQTSGTQTRSYDFNNLTGTGNSNVARYLLMTHVSVANEGMNNLDEWGSFKSVSATETWTYRVIFTFNGNGNTGGSMSNQTIDNTGTLSANAFSRTGYTFSKWTANQDGSGSVLGNKASVTASSSYKGPKTIYAQWTANKYTVTLNNQSATTAGSTSVEATYNAAIPSITVPTRTGYTFGGYYTEANGKGTQYIKADGTSAKNWDKTANTTLYAKWDIKTYSISYNLDGGEVTVANPTEYTIETETFTLTNPTKEGYTFTGWTGSNGEEPQTEVTIAKGSTENKSYTANWTVILKPCELSWLNVPEGGVVGTIGHEDEIVLPQVNASQDFILAFQAHTATLRLGSTDESVLAVYGFNNFAVNGVGECDVYVVHDEDAVFAYDSAAFHVTVNPEPEPAPTVWTALKVGDVIKVGDQLSPSVEWESANDYGVIKPDWAPYTLLRANIAQEHEWDDPVVTEGEDGAYYVFKFTHPTSGTCYLLANSAKSPLLAATATSDGLEVTNVGDDYGTPAFTFAVHENGSAPTGVENVQTNEVQASKLMENGVLYILHNGTMYNVQGTRVR